MSSIATVIGYAACMLFPLAQVDSSEGFQTFLDQRNAVDTLTARFHQETISPGELIESDGSLVYVNPKRILFRYDDPPISYMIDAKRNYEFDEEMEQLLVYDLEGGPEAEAFFLGFENNKTKVLEAYNISFEPSEDPTLYAPTVVLTPKTEDPEEMLFERVYMKMNLKNSMPSQIIIINDEENKVVFNIDQFQINKPIAPDVGQLSIPEGTEIIINDESVGQAGEGGKTYPESESNANGDTQFTSGSELVDSEPLEKVSKP